MKCEQVSSELVSLLYDELEGTQKREILSHLDGCQLCQREWKELRSGRDLLSSLEHLEEEQQFDENHCRVRVDSLYAAATARSVRQNRLWRRATVAAVAASLLMLLFSFTRLSLSFEQNRLTLRWGNSEASSASQQALGSSVSGSSTSDHSAVEGLAADGSTSSEVATTHEIAEQFQACLERLRSLENRFDSAVTQVEVSQARQGEVIASLENQLDQFRRTSDVRWRTTDLARQQLAAVQRSVNAAHVRINQKMNLTRSKRPQRGG